MRTTLTLDADVAQEVKALSKKGRPIKQVVNEALRIGLAQMSKPPKPRPYRGPSFKMGLRPGFSYDNIGELLAQAEGEDYK